MTIIYDPALRRSTHLESGLAVQWVRDEPPMERSTRFKLIANGSEVQFDGTNDYGEYKIQKLYPDADFMEVHRRASDLKEINYSAVCVRGRFDEELFVKVWQHLLQQEHGHGVYRVSARYTVFTGDDPESGTEWKCEG
jgi:hypothetical protein